MRRRAFCRAGHASAWDEQRGGMWVYGGYSTFYPYISSDGAGSDYGTTVREHEKKKKHVENAKK